MRVAAGQDRKVLIKAQGQIATKRSVGLRPALRQSECKFVWVFDPHEFDRNTYSAGRRPTLRDTLAGRRPTLRCVYHPRAFTAADAD